MGEAACRRPRERHSPGPNLALNGGGETMYPARRRWQFNGGRPISFRRQSGARFTKYLTIYRKIIVSLGLS